MTWQDAALWLLAALVSAELVILLHESSHAICILLSGHRVVIFKPWPHLSAPDSFGRRRWYWGRASSGTQHLGAFWEPANAFAPFVTVGLLLLGLGLALLLGGMPRGLAGPLLVTLFLACAVDRFWGFLQGALGIFGDLEAGLDRLGVVRVGRAAKLMGWAGVALVPLWAAVVAFRLVAYPGSGP
jgi:hypothetical protein